ncbi:hypothetical protein [Reinekea forsetii]|jgi:hypothetical protein|uniref:hypothetical protein n=1 Tax=Reinekea forsetii TaxID=1336806 RepID=UPI0023564DDC|nr:hypothetical protein [Reinekea forsetii]
MLGVKSTDQTVLFLYGDVSLLGVLKSALLPLQVDLSVLAPYIDLDQWQDHRTQAVSVEEFQAEMVREYLQLPDNVRQILSLEAFQAQGDRLADTIQARALANRKPTDLAYSRRRLEKIGYLRLFSSALSHFGWSSLAADQSGICLALNSTNAMFSPTPGTPVLLRKVGYGAEHRFTVNADNPLPGFFCDHAENQGRDEWRVAYGNPADIHLPESAISQIYTSINTPPGIKQALRDLVAKDLRYRHVELLEVLPDPQRWQLVAKPYAKT